MDFDTSSSSSAAAALSTDLMQLSSLQNASLGYYAPARQPAGAAAAMLLGNMHRPYWRAWAELPLKSLMWIGEQVPAAVVHQLGSLNSLTHLRISPHT
jgi:hypothetical protein